MASWMGSVMQALPVGPRITLMRIKEANGQFSDYTALGLEGDVSIGNRLKFVQKLIGYNNSNLKTVARWLPTMSIGGAISSYAGDIKTAIKLKIGLPPVLGDALKMWENSLRLDGKAKARLSPSADFEVHESTKVSDPVSPIDTVTKYSVGITLEVNGGQVVTGKMEHSTAMRTVAAMIDGKMRTVVIERRTTAIKSEVPLGEILGVNGSLTDSHWYFYEYGTRKPVKMNYNKDLDKVFVGDRDTTNDIFDLMNPAEDPNAAADEFKEIVITARPRVPKYDLTGTTADGRQLNASKGKSVTRDAAGNRLTATGARSLDGVSTVVEERTDGTKTAVLSLPGTGASDGRSLVVETAANGDMLANGAEVGGVFARDLERYVKQIVESDADVAPPILLVEDGALTFVDHQAEAQRKVQYDLGPNGVPYRRRVSQEGADYWVEVSLDSRGRAVATDIHFSSKPFPVEFSDAGGIIGQTIGSYLANGDVLTSIVYSSVLQTLGDNFGDALDGIVGGESVSHALNDAFGTLPNELLSNIRAAGIGALSSFLVSELVNVIGAEGLAAEALNSVAGHAINNIISNAAQIALGRDVSLFSGVTDLAQLGKLAGSFIGNQLASLIGDWDEVGEQLGSSIGGSIGGLVGAAIPIPVLGSIIGSFLGNLLGGLIGGLFTGTPKSGAIVGFNESAGEFAVESVWKKSGGKKSVANELGNAVADSLNGIVSFVGGDLVNSSEIEAGSYGMRGKRYVYWLDGTDSDNRIKPGASR